MIRIAISSAAFDVISRHPAAGSVAFEPTIDEKGNREIWLEPHVVDRLLSLRGPGENYSDVILRLAAVGGLAA